MRYRFADRNLEIDAHGAGTISTAKAFPRSEGYFDGAFRRENEVPSSLILESMATAGSFLLTVKSHYRAHALLLKVNRAVFSRPVLAGDSMVVRSRVAGIQGDWSRLDTSGEPVRRGRGARPVQCGRGPRGGCLPVLSRTSAFADARFQGGRGSDGLLELLGYVDTRP